MSCCVIEYSTLLLFQKTCSRYRSYQTAQRFTQKSAAKLRKNAAHSASCGYKAQRDQAPEPGAKRPANLDWRLGCSLGVARLQPSDSRPVMMGDLAPEGASCARHLCPAIQLRQIKLWQSLRFGGWQNPHSPHTLLQRLCARRQLWQHPPANHGPCGQILRLLCA
jgi:hypothetical protein